MSLTFDLALMRPLIDPPAGGILDNPVQVSTHGGGIYRFPDWPKIRNGLLAAQNLKNRGYHPPSELTFYVDRYQGTLELDGTTVNQFVSAAKQYIENVRPYIEALWYELTPPDDLSCAIAVSTQDISPNGLRALADHTREVMRFAISDAPEIRAVSGGSCELLIVAGLASAIGLQVAAHIAGLTHSNEFAQTIEYIKLVYAATGREIPSGSVFSQVFGVLAKSLLSDNEAQILKALDDDRARYNEADDKIVKAASLMHQHPQFEWTPPPQGHTQISYGKLTVAAGNKEMMTATLEALAPYAAREEP